MTYVNGLAIVEGTNDLYAGSGAWLRADLDDFERYFVITPEGVIMEIVDDTTVIQEETNDRCDARTESRNDE